MIHFEYIKYKNILSTGDAWTEIRLDDSKSTLIVGENGAGKCLRGSTEIDVEIEDDEVRKKFEEFVKNS